MKLVFSVLYILCIALYTPYVEAQAQRVHSDKVWVSFKTTDNHYSLLQSEREVFFKKYKQTFHIKQAACPFKTQELQHIYKVVLDSEFVEDFIYTLARNKEIEYIERCPIFSLYNIPNDTLNKQWYLSTIRAFAAWDYAGTGSTTIAVIDDAVKTDHPDLEGNIYINYGEIPGNAIDDDGNGYIDDTRGYDVSENDTDVMPPAGAFGSYMMHGTHIAGIAGAVTNNRYGIASVSYNTSKILPVKASTLPTVLTNVEEGIAYAVACKPRIINMSFGGTDTSNYKTLFQVLKTAENSGIFLIAAAGNDGKEERVYPAAYDFVFAAGATDAKDQVSKYSNYGTFIDIMAPGDSIYSCVVASNRFDYQSGTSMSAPMVAAASALLLSINPTKSNTKLRNCLTGSAEPIEAINDSKYIGKTGAGRLNIEQAMICSKNNSVALVDDAKDWQIFPSVANSEVYIQSLQNHNKPCVIEFLSGTGALVFKEEILQGNKYINVSEYAVGVYIIRIIDDRKIYTKKILILR